MMSPGTISARGDAPPLAVADDGGVGRRHRAQRGDGRLGARLLDVAHRRVEQHDGEDRDRFVGQRRVALERPQAGRDRGRDEQQDDEHVLELREEPAPRRDRRLARELVRLRTARVATARVVLAQAALAVGAERRDDLLDALPGPHVPRDCPSSVR